MLITTKTEPLIKDLVLVYVEIIINEVNSNNKVDKAKSVIKKNPKLAKFKNILKRDLKANA